MIVTGARSRSQVSKWTTHANSADEILPIFAPNYSNLAKYPTVAPLKKILTEKCRDYLDVSVCAVLFGNTK